MIKIGQKTATVEDPLGHLTACHRRIEQRLETLERAGEWLGSPDAGKRAEAIGAIASALRFLDSSGVLHTVDEEESVFPRLVSKLESSERDYVEALERQHRVVDAAYADLKRTIGDGDFAAYREAASRVAKLYREHIASEDVTLIAMAQRCLSPDEVTAISAEMRARRGRA